MKRLISCILICAMLLAMLPFAAASALTVSAASAKLVAFTFDDGPSPYTAGLLDSLKARGAKATFFVTGVNGKYSGAVYHRDVLRRIVSEGHQLANHTNSHYVPFDELSASSIRSEVSTVNNYISTAAGGSYQTLVRTPGGATSSRIKTAVSAPIILWDVDSLDWQSLNANAVRDRILADVSDGSIVLLHDLYPTSIRGALAAMDILKKQGYECVTVSELFRRRGMTLKNGSVYYAAYNKGTTLAAYKAPSISCTQGPVKGKARVTLSAQKGLTLYYTTDGSTPTLASKRYTAPVDIPYGTTVKIAGFDKFGTRTPILTKAITCSYVGAFDAAYYSSRYADLKKAFGTNATLLLNHFLKYGLKEGRQASPMFSVTYYMQQHPELQDTCKTRLDYVQHFISVGMHNGYRGSAQFDPVSYRLRYADLRRAFGNNWSSYYTHYLKYGIKEKRSAVGCTAMVQYTTVYNGIDYAPLYDYNYYIKHSPDVLRAFGYDDQAVLKHFVIYGMKEGRRASASFRVQTYRDRYADLRKAYGTNLKSYYLHYLRHGVKEGRKGI